MIEFKRRAEAAAYLKSRYGQGTPGTLAKLACVGGGPPFRKFGKFPLYTTEDLDAWATGRLSPRVANTSSVAA